MTSKAKHLEAVAKAFEEATDALDRAKAEFDTVLENINPQIGGKTCIAMAIDVRGITSELHVMRHHVITEINKEMTRAE